MPSPIVKRSKTGAKKQSVEINSVGAWYRQGLFKTDQEAQGAFRLARAQYQDGLGEHSCHEWMGLTEPEFNAWMSDDTLPNRGRR